MKRIILIFILHLIFSKEFFGKSNRVPLNEQAIEQTLKKNQASIQFIENKGQWDNRASFHGKAMNTDLWFTKQGMRLDAFSLEQDNTLRDEQGYKVIDTNGIRKGQVWDMHFVGMNAEAKYKPKAIRKEYYNYFIGNDSTKWAGNVKLYNELWHEDIYRGIDLRYYSNDKGILEYDFIVQPHTDYQSIKFTIEGAEHLHLNEHGDLMIGTKYLGELPISKPISYQITASGERKYLQTIYVQNGNNFSYLVLDPIDPTLELIIDPQLKYSTFLFCWTCSNYSYDIDANNSGHAVATGYASNSGFPTTPGAYQVILSSSIDIFVSVLNNLGSSLIFSTFIGGTSSEFGLSVAFDAFDNVLITGSANSSNYPVLFAAQSIMNSLGDAFVTKLNKSGNGLHFSTFLGGSNSDISKSIYIDSKNNVLVCGVTSSQNFPITLGALKTSIQPNTAGQFHQDGFVTKYNSFGKLIYSTYIGETHADGASSITTDKYDNIYVGGSTSSSDFMVTKFGYDTSYNGAGDGFMLKLDSTLSSLIYSTYIGGNFNESIRNIVVSKDGLIYGVGNSGSSNFPLTKKSYKDTLIYGEGFVVCLDSSGQFLKHATAIGRGNLYGIGINDCGAVFISGFSYYSNYPITVDAYSNFKGGVDNVITVLDSALSQLLYSTFVGGNNADYGEASIAVKNNVFYVSGTTHSKDFPTTPGAFQTNKTHNGDTPYMLAFENMCFLPDATDIVVNPSSFCGFSVKPSLFKAKPRPSKCGTNAYSVYWRLSNGSNSSLIKGDSVIINVGPMDLITVFIEDTIVHCKSAELKVSLDFGGIKKNQFKSICFNDSIFLQKKYRKTSGIYRDTISYPTCDTIVTTQLNVIPFYDIQVRGDICPGDTFVCNLKKYSATGIFKDTVKSLITCDSIFTVDVRVIPLKFFKNIRICSGKTYRVGTHIYITSGIYIDSLKNYLGCDSIITTYLQVLSRIEDTLIGNYCNGDVVFIGKNMYNASGNYRDTMNSSGGCDSFMTSYLNFAPSVFYEDTVFYCERDSFFIFGKKYAGIYANQGIHNYSIKTDTLCQIYSTLAIMNPMKFVAHHVYFCEDDEGYQIGKNTYFVSGIYRDTIKQVNGCDSVLEINLHIIPKPTPINYSQFFKICQGDTLKLPNKKITTAGSFIDTFKNIAGCDSAYITAIVSIKNKSFTTIDTSFCKGEKIIVGSKTYDSTGNYTIKLTNYLNCDSVITLKLIVYPKYNLTVNRTICSGASFHFKGQYLTNAGVYRDTLISSKGCDSLVTLNLTILSSYFSLVNQSICQGDSILFGKVFRFNTGQYFDSLKAASGCDSIAELDLVVYPTYYLINPIQRCSGQFYQIGKHSYSKSGIYIDSFKSAHFCDSIIETRLTINSIYRDTIKRNLCQGQVYSYNNKSRTTSGLYVDSFLSSFGCDSLVYSMLQFYPVFTTQRSITLCAGKSLFVGGALQTSSGLYRDTFQSIHFCDSILETNLTILPPLSSNVYKVICSGQNYWTGKRWVSLAGVYMDTLKNAFLCDSIVTTNLKVNPAYHQTFQIRKCQGDAYFAQGKWQSQPGLYTDYFKTYLGCDSTVVTNLSFDTSYKYVTVDRTCANKPYQFQNKSFSKSGDYLVSYKAANRCDSSYILHLTVDNNPRKFSELNTCFGKSIFHAGKDYWSNTTVYDTLPQLNACDSIHVVQLKFTPIEYQYINGVLCKGEKYYFNSNWLTEEGFYRDTLTNTIGCDSIVVLNLEQEDCPPKDACNRIYMPTAFTPNDDGVNDGFRPILKSDLIKLDKMIIHNRWGELVFDSEESISFNWNPQTSKKEMQMGVYAYSVRYTCRGERNIITGNVTLLK